MKQNVCAQKAATRSMWKTGFSAVKKIKSVNNMEYIRQWFKRNFSDPQVIILVMFLLLGGALIVYLGEVIAPVIASVIIAYLLEGVVKKLEAWRLPRMASVLIVFTGFMAFLFFVILGLIPRLTNQIAQIVAEIPAMVNLIQSTILMLPERFPDYFSEDNIKGIMQSIQSELGNLGHRVVSISVASMKGAFIFLVYLVLVPLMVFFFLKDKNIILQWFSRFIPENAALSSRVWHDVDRQIGNYIRGKIWEILIVWAVSTLTFYILGLKYAMLAGLMVGLSVLIPYVGAIVVFFPIATMAYFTMGWSNEFIYICVAYLVIQFFDGNLLAPLLLSGVVDLHPISVLISIIVFGHIWGFWGVFFAIPLATLVQSVITAWPRHKNYQSGPVQNKSTTEDPEKQRSRKSVNNKNK